MHLTADDASSATIVAQATAAAPGGVGILRVSGPHAIAACLPLVPTLMAREGGPEPRRAYTVTLCARDGTPLDVGLWLSFAAPASYTGEEVVELHAHGSPGLLQMLQREVLGDARVRLAEPGEFTRRAFLNGKLDLTQAEAVADLIAASSELAVRAAGAQLRGALSKKLREVLEPLRVLHADLEALLDFPEESEGAETGLVARLEELLAPVETLLEGARRGRWAREGARVALYGPPNAGKSTLFNALLGAPRALVDEEPGTTRDVLEARWQVGPLRLTLLDTAGLREAPGRIEQRGMNAAREALSNVEAALLVLPAGPLSEAERTRWEAELPVGVPRLLLRSKADLHPGDGSAPVVDGTLRVSAQTGEGLEALRGWILEQLGGEDVSGAVLVTGERHASALERMATSLRTARDAAQAEEPLELVAGEVMLAHDALSELLGERPDQALLDTLFARFCIGK